MLGHLTEKTDVFAFGIVALEIVSGRPNSSQDLNDDQTYLLEWVLLYPIVKMFWKSHFGEISSFTNVAGMEPTPKE